MTVLRKFTFAPCALGLTLSLLSLLAFPAVRQAIATSFEEIS
jgi:hypothetical protein